MPPASGSARADSLGEMGVLIQGLVDQPEVGDWLAHAEAQKPKLQPMQVANLRCMQRIYLENTAVPSDLNRRLTVARGKAEQSWRQLRTDNNWKDFLPQMREVLQLTRESLSALGSAMGLSLYDSALNLHSRGLTTKNVEVLFNELKAFLPGLADRVLAKQGRAQILVPEGVFPVQAQKALCRELMTTLGFDISRGRLDESHHPFCGGNPHDVRITTRYRDNEFISSLLGVLHETGHALYEQNLPREWVEQPVGQPCGMAIHESQSLLMEMQIVHSPEFLEFAAPLMRRHFQEHVKNPKSLETDNLIRLINRVERGWIRVDADEVTYPLHVILRFEIERDLLEDRWPLEELPAVWDIKMRQYLGISTLGNDRNGCMQDVHWPGGAFGYFPAYTFGAVIAAQLFAKIANENPSVRQQIRQGEFQAINTWLRERIWNQGSLHDTLELVESACGPLGTVAYQRHLESRYL